MSETIYDFEAPLKEKKTGEVLKELQYLGQNKQGVVFVVDDEDHDYMSPTCFDAFQKTVQALGLQLEDIALLNKRHMPVEQSLVALRQQLSIVKLILLGATAILDGLPQMTMNTVTEVSATKVLFSYGFDEMLAEVEKRKFFWKQLKGMF